MLLSDLQQASFSFPFVCRHTCLHFAPLIFLFFPKLVFHLFTCLCASLCQSVYHSDTISNKLVCLGESLSSRTVLITITVSVILWVCHSNRLCVCFFFIFLCCCSCLCVSGATLPPFYVVAGNEKVKASWPDQCLLESQSLSHSNPESLRHKEKSHISLYHRRLNLIF